MVFSASKVLILLLCVGMLSVQPEKAFGLRSLELALRPNLEDHRIMLQNQHTLKTTNMEVMGTKKNSATMNRRVDPNQSSKRRVRRGSDPIHNRSSSDTACNSKKCKLKEYCFNTFCTAPCWKQCGKKMKANILFLVDKHYKILVMFL